MKIFGIDDNSFNLKDLFKFNKSTNDEQKKKEIPVHMGALLYNRVSNYTNSKAMQLPAFFCGVEQISNGVAMLPMDVVKYDNDELAKVEHPLWKVLNVKPNAKYTPYFCMKSAIEHIIMKGAAYFYIKRNDNLDVEEIIPIENDFVTPLLQEDGTVKYSIAGFGIVDSVNVLDFAMRRDLTFKGISLLKYAFSTLEGSQDINDASSKFYRSGAGLAGILKATQTLTKEQREQIRSSWNEAFSSSGNGIAIIPSGLDWQPTAIDPVEAQMLESRKYSLEEIARFLNISPIKLHKIDDASYNSMENDNVYFVQETLRPYCEMITDEINLKCFKPSEVGKIGISFDYQAALKSNKQAEAEYYRTLMTNGLATPNEIRKKLGFPPISKEEGGDSLLIQISYGTLSDVAQGRYIKQNAQDQNTNQDNKLK